MLAVMPLLRARAGLQALPLDNLTSCCPWERQLRPAPAFMSGVLSIARETTSRARGGALSQAEDGMCPKPPQIT